MMNEEIQVEMNMLAAVVRLQHVSDLWEFSPVVVVVAVGPNFFQEKDERTFCHRL